MTDRLLWVTGRRREGARPLDAPTGVELLADPPIAALREAARQSSSEAGARVVLRGGEPTLRADLPALIEALADHAPVLRTDGLALGQATTLRALERVGLRAVRVVLHAARADANDWLVGHAGATKAALRALREAASVGLRTEIEATITRPSAPHVAELLGLAERLGVRAVHLRRLVLRGAAQREAVMLSARFGLLEDPLEEAAAAAIRARVALRVHGFPRCVAPRIGPALAPAAESEELFADTAEWTALSATLAPSRAAQCAACPGTPSCAGAPLDYVERFGMQEILSERGAADRTLTPAAAGVTIPREPPARAGRSPATRVSSIRRMVAAGPALGDPLLEVAQAPPAALSVHFDDPEHEGAGRPSSRALRARLIRAAQEGARSLLIVGGLDHPDAPALLREAARLPGPEVIVSGDVSALFTMSDADIYGLKGLRRIEAMLASDSPAGHDARTRAGHFEAQRTFLERCASIAGVEVGYYAVLQPGDSLDGFAEFEVHRVRLAEAGGPLGAVAAAWRALPSGAFADALASVLPTCLNERSSVHQTPVRYVHQATLDAPVGPNEPLGRFARCECGSETCIGVARGWRL